MVTEAFDWPTSPPHVPAVQRRIGGAVGIREKTDIAQHVGALDGAAIHIPDQSAGVVPSADHIAFGVGVIDVGCTL